MPHFEKQLCVQVIYSPSSSIPVISYKYLLLTKILWEKVLLAKYLRHEF